VRKSLLGLLGFATALILSTTTVFAVGMGGINVGSGLGQQLKADIELMSVSKAEKASLVARLASPAAYKEAGLEYPYGNKFRFKIESRPNGDSYISVISEEQINDPFVIMLVELTWSSGKLLREYTFLLDPPGYVPEQPQEAAVQAVSPVIPSAPAETPATPAVQIAPVAPAPMAQTAPLESAPVEPQEQTGQLAQPTEAKTVAEPPPPRTAASPAPARQAVRMEEMPELDEWIAIKRGDTLREVADRYRQADMSLDRMLVALYRANANKFDGKNMNRIRAGKILRLPHQNEVEAVSQGEAVREIRAQAADWNVYRQKLASAAPARVQPKDAPQQVATGKISSSVADMAPPVKESAKEVLRLSRGEAPGDGTATGPGAKIITAQDRKNAEQEEAIARSNALKEEQARVAMLEKQLAELKRLAELKTGAAALAQSTQTPEPSAEKPQVQLQPQTPQAQPQVQPQPSAQPQVQSKPQPKQLPPPVVAEPESILDQAMAVVDQVVTTLEELLGDMLYPAVGAVLLLAVLGVVMARRKGGKPAKPKEAKPAKPKGGESFKTKWIDPLRQKILELFQRKKKQSSDGIGEAFDEAEASAGNAPFSGRIAAPEVSSPDTGDFTQMGGAGDAVQQSDNVDPIGEADLFLNFGRDAQAEDILKEALQSNPNDHRIHLKLLGIYANRVDTNSFSVIARQLQESGDEEAWQKALEMGRKLEPNNPLYGGSGDIESTGSATAQAAAFDATQLFSSDNAPAAQPSEIDFNIDLGSPSASAVSTPEQNFLGDTDQNAIMSFDILSSGQAPEMDLNVAEGSGGGASGEEAMPDIGGLAFDLGESSAPPPEEQTLVSNSPMLEETVVAKPAEADDGGMEFTLDFPVGDAAEKAAPEAPLPTDMGLAGISLSFDDAMAPSEPAPSGKDEHWLEVATKLDLAKAYQEMGDAGGAREILEEVMRDGDEGQREAAQNLLNQLA